MIFGFTGTRYGMTTHQKIHVRALLHLSLQEPGPHVFHHGDCIGSDYQATEIAAELGYITIAHPGINPRKPDSLATRAGHPSTLTLPAFPFLVRDRHIVDACQRLIATPAQDIEMQRSGTWTTVRYARKKSVPVEVVWLNGHK
jgi:hypothetical protein